MKLVHTVFLTILLLVLFPCALSETRGPVDSYGELLSLVRTASAGDVLLIEGELSAKGYPPLNPSVPLTIRASGSPAVIRSLRLHNAEIAFSGVELLDSLSITGSSYVELGQNVTVQGEAGKSGVSFTGTGELLIDRSCSIVGGSKSTGLSISQQDGSLYVGMEGRVTGGSSGGAGMSISPLKEMGTMMISGSVTGGDSASIGGHALNLYNLSGNAFITINGTLQGGPGAVGGDGIQLVDIRDTVSIGVDGSISGGQGQDFGGDALMLLNVTGSSAVNLSGTLTGGNVTSGEGQPGTSLLVVGERSSVHMRPETQLLSGVNLADVSEPDITPLPDIAFADHPGVPATPMPELISEANDEPTNAPNIP